MNKIINLQRNSSRIGLLFSGTMIAILTFSLLGTQSAYAAITSHLDFGDSNLEVTELQTYLATNTSIYPEGLVTGYFGQLTKAAVERFQATQGIVSQGTPETTGYGRVGPQTMARINSLLGSGGGSQVWWDTSPSLSNPMVQHTNTSATFTWASNEPTQGQVYWSNTPLQFSEATGPHQQPYVSGTLAIDAGGFQTNHAVMVSNLQSNTTYYYLVRGVDSAGNMSMVWPSFFRTNQ
ncbi:MAG: peptidoglycan-binding protein [Patescibacteria group bacterium]|nr:peptidoglycan-binding protein [Patescibacteria group bacterium]